MKKLIFVLTLLLLVSPALAKVEISCTSDNGVVSVYYAMSSGDTNLPRAFGLDVELSNDANIVSAGNFNPSFWVHPGSIDINTVVVPPVIDSNGTAIASIIKYPGKGLIGPPDSNGMTIEMGSLYASGDPAPANNGLLFTFTVDAECDVAISGNTARGKVVLETADEDNSDYGTGCSVVLGCPTCVGDLVGATSGAPANGIVDLVDLGKMGGLLNKAKYYNGVYSFLVGDPNVNFANDICADIVGATSSAPPNGTVDLVDLGKMGGLLNKAKYYNGVYSFPCGDPNI